MERLAKNNVDVQLDLYEEIIEKGRVIEQLIKDEARRTLMLLKNDTLPKGAGTITISLETYQLVESSLDKLSTDRGLRELNGHIDVSYFLPIEKNLKIIKALND